MKRIFYFIIVSIVAFFSNLYSRIAYGQEAQGNVFYGTVMSRTLITFRNTRSIIFIFFFFFFFFVIPLLSIFAFKNRGRVLITFMDKGKKVTKLVKIISKEKGKVVFKDKEKTYRCNRSDIIRIKKKNVAKIILIILLVSLLLLLTAGNVVDYMTRQDSSPVMYYEE